MEIEVRILIAVALAALDLAFAMCVGEWFRAKRRHNAVIRRVGAW